MARRGQRNRVVITAFGETGPGARFLHGHSYIAACSRGCHVGNAVDTYEEALADRARVQKQHDEDALAEEFGDMDMDDD